jgi:hypothetical protein
VLSLLTQAQGSVAHPPEVDGLRVSCLQFSVILAISLLLVHTLYFLNEMPPLYIVVP